jgi:hypothetical protein
MMMMRRKLLPAVLLPESTAGLLSRRWPPWMTKRRERPVAEADLSLVDF